MLLQTTMLITIIFLALTQYFLTKRIIHLVKVVDNLDVSSYKHSRRIEKLEKGVFGFTATEKEKQKRF